MIGLLVRHLKTERVCFLNTNHSVKICEIFAYSAYKQIIAVPSAEALNVSAFFYIYSWPRLFSTFRISPKSSLASESFLAKIPGEWKTGP